MYKQYKKGGNTDKALDIDIKVEKNDQENGIKDVLNEVKPKWKREDIKIEHIADGYINLMAICKIDDNKSDWVIVRVFGGKTMEENMLENLGMDRSFEKLAGPLFEEMEIGAPVLGRFHNGVVYGFLDAKSFSWFDVTPFRDVNLRNAVARALAHVHSLETFEKCKSVGLDKAPNALKFIEKMIEGPMPELILDKKTTDWYYEQIPDVDTRTKEANMIYNLLTTTSIPHRFCHNDTNPTNIMYQEETGKLFIVDLEACSVNIPIFDISNFLDGSAVGLTGDPFELEYTRQEKEDFMRTYLSERNRLDHGKEDVDDADVKKYTDICEMFMIGGAYLVHIYAPQFVADEESKIFLDVGIKRLDYYNKNKERMLSLHS